MFCADFGLGKGGCHIPLIDEKELKSYWELQESMGNKDRLHCYSCSQIYMLKDCLSSSEAIGLKFPKVEPEIRLSEWLAQVGAVGF